MQVRFADSRAACTDKLQTRKWMDQSGTEKYMTEIVLQKYRGELTMLGGRSDSHRTDHNQQGGGQDQSSVGSTTSQADVLDDEVPW